MKNITRGKFFKILGMSITSLVLPSCSIIPILNEKSKNIDDLVKSGFKIISDYDTPVVFKFSRISDYNPSITKEKIEVENEYLKKIIKGGCDAWSLWFDKEESEVVENENKFEEVILKDAKKLDYSSEKIKTLSPNEGIALACELTANRLDYHGNNKRNEAKKELEIIDEQIQNLQKKLKKISDKEMKELIGFEIKQKKEVRKYAEEYLKIVSAVTTGFLSGVATAEYDDWPVDKIYIEKPEIVCRHYSRIVKGVFNKILKKLSPNLENTYISCYNNDVEPFHRWNQATTVVKNEGRTILYCTFVDPTFLDNMGKLDAFDKRHLGENLGGLNKQVKTIYKNLSISEKLSKRYKNILNK